MRTWAWIAAAVVVAGACSSSSPSAGGRLRVVAAENVWGSIAAQLGGPLVEVRSLVRNPNADPHDYEPTVADGRAVAHARYVIYNGVGYDPWASKLVAATAKPAAVLDVGKLVGIGPGGNPHRWYAPGDVAQVVGRITADYQRLDPAHAADFAARRRAFVDDGLARYRSLIAEIKTRFGAAPVGASESVFAPLAEALGLRLLTPAGFLGAVSEGTDPSAADKAEADRQIKERQIKVFVFNRQNATPDVQAEVAAARSEGIPVVAITETLSPATALFQDWQTAQMQELARALGGSR
jgi:zinc/manganese transport system substrate-binding protein